MKAFEDIAIEAIAKAEAVKTDDSGLVEGLAQIAGKLQKRHRRARDEARARLRAKKK